MKVDLEDVQVISKREFYMESDGEASEHYGESI